MKKLIYVFCVSFIFLCISCNKNNNVIPRRVAQVVTIDAISPASGGFDTLVTITGSNFSTLAANNTVRFNGVKAVIQSATTTSIKAIVPVGAGTGPITVATNTSIAVKGPVFTYNPIVTIYFAGNDGPNAVYWQNGTEYNLPFTTSLIYLPNAPNAYTYNIAAAGSDVYITGYNGSDFVYWKNGIPNTLPLYTSSLAISGSDLYFAGYFAAQANYNSNQSTALYWKNGTIYTLPFVSSPSGTSAVTTSGTDVYFAGADGSNLVYWKNGIEFNLPVASNPPTAAIFTMAISGKDIYSAGIDGQTPVYWKNGVEHVLPTFPNPGGVPNGVVTAMAVTGTDVYFVGKDFRTAVYWKNGVEIELPFLNNTSTSSNATGIAIAGTDVYITGGEANVNWPSVGAIVTSTAPAEYWKNGKPYALSLVNKDNGGVTGIAIVSK